MNLQAKRRRSRGRDGPRPRPRPQPRVGPALLPGWPPLGVFWLCGYFISKIPFLFFLEFSTNFSTLHKRKTPNAILLKTASVRVSSKQFIKNQRQSSSKVFGKVDTFATYQPPSSPILDREGSEALPGTLPEKEIITGGIYTTIPASGVMRGQSTTGLRIHSSSQMVVSPLVLHCLDLVSCLS